MAIDADEVRSDAQELLDAGAHDRLDTMRHSAAHIMAAAVLELFPEAKLGIGPAIRDGFYYDFDLPRALTPADLEAIEERMRAQVTGNLPFERSELDRSAALNQLENEGQDYKVEIVRELPDGDVISFYRHGAFNDLCRGPHLETTGGPGTVQAAELGRGVLAGRRAPPDAAAHLRHGLGVAGGPGPLPVAAGRGQEARPPQARPRPGPVHLPPGVAGRPVLASARHGHVAGAGAVVARGAALGRLRRGPHAEPGAQGAVGDLGPLGALPGQHVRPRRPRAPVGPEADELPAGDPDLQDQGALLPRAADPLRRLLGALPQGADRRPVGHVPGAAAGAGRLARLLPRRAGDRRDQPGAGPGAPAVRAVRHHAQLQAGHAAGEAAGLRRVLGHGRGQAEDGAGAVGHAVRHGSRRRRVLRPQDRHLLRGRARPRVAERDRAARLSAAPALRPGVPRGGWRLRAAGDHPLRHLRLVRALHGGHHRALRRRLPAVAGAGAGDGHPHRGSPPGVRGAGA